MSIPALFLFYTLMHSVPCKTGCKLILLGKVSPLNPPSISFSFVTTCYLHHSSSSGIKQQHYEHKAKSWPQWSRYQCIYQCLQLVYIQHFTGRICNNPKLLYSFPCPLCSITFLTCKWNAVKRQHEFLFRQNNWLNAYRKKKSQMSAFLRQQFRAPFSCFPPTANPLVHKSAWVTLLKNLT